MIKSQFRPSVLKLSKQELEATVAAATLMKHRLSDPVVHHIEGTTDAQLADRIAEAFAQSELAVFTAADLVPITHDAQKFVGKSSDCLVGSTAMFWWFHDCEPPLLTDDGIDDRFDLQTFRKRAVLFLPKLFGNEAVFLQIFEHKEDKSRVLLGHGVPQTPLSQKSAFVASCLNRLVRFDAVELADAYDENYGWIAVMTKVDYR